MFGFCFQIGWDVYFVDDGQLNYTKVNSISLSDVKRVALIAVDSGKDVAVGNKRAFSSENILVSTDSKSGYYSTSFPGDGRHGGQGRFTVDGNVDGKKDYYMMAEDSKGNALISNKLHLGDKKDSTDINQNYQYQFVEEGLIFVDTSTNQKVDMDQGDDLWRPTYFISSDANNQKTELKYPNSYKPDFYWGTAVGSESIPEPAVAVSLLLGLSALLLKRRNPVV